MRGLENILGKHDFLVLTHFQHLLKAGCSAQCIVFLVFWTYLLRFLNRELIAEKFTLIWTMSEELMEHNAIAQSPKQTAGRSHTFWECSVTHSASTVCIHLGSACAFKQNTLCLIREALFAWFWNTELSGQLALVSLCSVEMQDVPLCVSRPVYYSASGGFLHTCVHYSQTLSWLCFPEADPKLTDA